jgi:hypothetical protein
LRRLKAYQTEWVAFKHRIFSLVRRQTLAFSHSERKTKLKFAETFLRDSFVSLPERERKRDEKPIAPFRTVVKSQLEIKIILIKSHYAESFGARGSGFGGAHRDSTRRLRPEFQKAALGRWVQRARPS